MEKRINKLLMILLALIVIEISGCTSSDTQTSTPPQINNNSRGRNFGNLTEEQRQQMMQQRLQMMASACQDKSEGDSCTTQSQRGERAGTCKTQNGKLLCSTGTYNRQGQPATNGQ